MIKRTKKLSCRFFFVGILILFLGCLGLAQEEAKALVLQEMSWTDVAEYLKTNDMVNNAVKFIEAWKKTKK